MQIVNGNKIEWVSWREQRQMALMIRCSSFIGTLLTVVYRCVHVDGHVAPVVFHSHFLLHSSLFEASHQSWVLCQRQERGLEQFTHNSYDGPIDSAPFRKEFITAIQNFNSGSAAEAAYYCDVFGTERLLIVPTFVACPTWRTCS